MKNYGSNIKLSSHLRFQKVKYMLIYSFIFSVEI